MKARSIKKLLLIVLALGIVLMGSGFVYALTVHELPGTGWSKYDRGFGTWTVTNQSDFQACVLNNVDVTSSPGDVKIGTSSSWLTGYSNRKSINVSAAQNTYLNSGGTVTTNGSYKVHTFTSSGTFTAGKAGNIQVLVVGGGGGAGMGTTNTQRNAGGGGAGGLIYIDSYSISSGSYTVNIGGGGSGASSTSSPGSNGSPSSFGTLAANGGGGGGSSGSRNGLAGGSGGGAGVLNQGGWNYGTGGSSNQPIINNGYPNTGFGNAGGTSNSSSQRGQGGGGAGAAGSGITGGAGGTYWSVTYARGGNAESDGTSSAANTGNGGNAAANSSGASGGSGGSGIVIVRCLTDSFLTDNSQTNYQMQLVVSNSSGVDSGSMVYLNGSSRNWPYDLRFTNSTGTALLDYWIQSYNSTTATIWVEFDAIPAYPNKGLFYIYCGNAAATGASNGPNTFLFFDDFSGGLGKWDTHRILGTVGINSSVGYPAPCLQVGGGSTSSPYGFTAVGTDLSYNTFQNGIIEADIYPATEALPEIIFRGNNASNTGYKGRWDCRTGTESPWMIYPYSGWTAFGTAVTRFGLANQWQSVKLVINGSAFSIYSNETLESTVTDTTYTSAGEIGVANHYGSYVLFDNIRVRKFAYPEPTWGAWGTTETPSFGTTSSIASTVFDTTHPGARWDLLAWDNASVAGTSVTFEARVSDVLFVSTNTTLSWQSVSNNPNLLGQYQQWRATLSTTNGSVTPVLSEVRSLYSW